MAAEEFEIVERSPAEHWGRTKTLAGKGAFKRVWKAVDFNTGRTVAWNEVNIAGYAKKDLARLVNEVKLLKTLKHGNLIRFFGIWDVPAKHKLVFITEFMDSGTIKEFRSKYPVTRNKIKEWCRGILECLHYLHTDAGPEKPAIIHRDLKCDNIFVSSQTKSIKVGDLGLATTDGKSAMGTPEFMAPDLFDGQYGTSVDVYSFGMCVLEMVTGMVPYAECRSFAQVSNKVLAGELPDSMRVLEVAWPAAHAFVLECLKGTAAPPAPVAGDPGTPRSERPSAEALLQHGFLGEDEADATDTDDMIAAAQAAGVSLPTIPGSESKAVVPKPVVEPKTPVETGPSPPLEEEGPAGIHAGSGDAVGAGSVHGADEAGPDPGLDDAHSDGSMGKPGFLADEEEEEGVAGAPKPGSPGAGGSGPVGVHAEEQPAATAQPDTPATVSVRSVAPSPADGVAAPTPRKHVDTSAAVTPGVASLSSGPSRSPSSGADGDAASPPAATTRSRMVKGSVRMESSAAAGRVPAGLRAGAEGTHSPLPAHSTGLSSHSSGSSGSPAGSPTVAKLAADVASLQGTVAAMSSMLRFLVRSVGPEGEAFLAREQESAGRLHQAPPAIAPPTHAPVPALRPVVAPAVGAGFTRGAGGGSTPRSVGEMGARGGSGGRGSWQGAPAARDVSVGRGSVTSAAGDLGPRVPSSGSLEDLQADAASAELDSEAAAAAKVAEATTALRLALGDVPVEDSMALGLAPGQLVDGQPPLPTKASAHFLSERAALLGHFNASVVEEFVKCNAKLRSLDAGLRETADRIRADNAGELKRHAERTRKLAGERADIEAKQVEAERAAAAAPDETQGDQDSIRKKARVRAAKDEVNARKAELLASREQEEDDKHAATMKGIREKEARRLRHRDTKRTALTAVRDKAVKDLMDRLVAGFRQQVQLGVADARSEQAQLAAPLLQEPSLPLVAARDTHTPTGGAAGLVHAGRSLTNPSPSMPAPAPGPMAVRSAVLPEGMGRPTPSLAVPSSTPTGTGADSADQTRRAAALHAAPPLPLSQPSSVAITHAVPETQPPPQPGIPSA